MNTRTIRFALAAAVILIVLGGVGLWPFGTGPSDPWWLGAPAAWGQEILHSLEEIEAIVYRQRVGYVSDYGPARMSRGYEIRFNAKDRYRRDRYDNGVDLMNTQWVLADGNDLRMIEVSYEYRCYFERKNEAYGYLEDLMGHLQSYVRGLDKADRILKTEVFDGRECVGFEARARHGNKPPARLDRIWFDVQTRLPARIERHYVNAAWDAGQTHIVIHDQFQYYAKVPVDLFTPQIPAGLCQCPSGRHPGSQRSAGQRPDGLCRSAPGPEREGRRSPAGGNLRLLSSQRHHDLLLEERLARRLGPPECAHDQMVHSPGGLARGSVRGR